MDRAILAILAGGAILTIEGMHRPLTEADRGRHVKMGPMDRYRAAQEFLDRLELAAEIGDDFVLRESILA